MKWHKLLLPIFLLGVGQAWAQGPRVVVLPAQMRNLPLVDDFRSDGPDPMETAVTEAVSRALRDSGAVTTIEYGEFLKSLDGKGRAYIESVYAPSRTRPSTLVVPRMLAPGTPVPVDLVVFTQFDLWRVPSTGRVRLSDISARVVYTGPGMWTDPTGPQQFTVPGRLRFAAGFPLESEVPEAVYSAFGRGLAEGMHLYHEESQRLAMDTVMEALSNAMKGSTRDKDAIQRLLSDVAALKGVVVRDPEEAWLIGSAHAAVGNGTEAVAWLTKARDDGMEPLERVLLDLGRTQAAVGQYQGAVKSLEQAYRLSRRKGLDSGGMLREMLAAAQAGGLRDKEAATLAMMANPSHLKGVSDKDRIGWLMRSASLQAELGNMNEAVQTLNQLTAGLLARDYGVDDTVRLASLVSAREALKDMGKGAEASSITRGLAAEAMAMVRGGAGAEGVGLLKGLAASDTLEAGEWFWLGYGSKALGETKDAEGAYLNALRLQPGMVPAMHNLRTILMAQGRQAETIGFLSAGRKELPRNPWVTYALAQAYLASGDWGQASAVLATVQPDEYWAPKYQRAIMETAYLQALTALGVDKAITTGAYAANPGAYLNKAVEWWGTSGEYKEGKAFNELTMDLENGTQANLRFYGQDRPMVGPGERVRFVGRITRIGDPPIIACTGILAGPPMDTVGEPKGVGADMIID